MAKCKNCHCKCHCDGDLHADDYGVCTCNNCKCKRTYKKEKNEKDPHLELYEDVPEPEIRVACEKHPDTYKKQCPSCRGTVNG